MSRMVPSGIANVVPIQTAKRYNKTKNLICSFILNRTNRRGNKIRVYKANLYARGKACLYSFLECIYIYLLEHHFWIQEFVEGIKVYRQRTIKSKRIRILSDSKTPGAIGCVGSYLAYIYLNISVQKKTTPISVQQKKAQAAPISLQIQEASTATNQSYTQA